MLAKKNRIKKDADFRTICRYGKSFFSKGLVIKVRENELGLVRVGVSVGLKFSRKAVTRNLVKRQVRAFFQQKLEKINCKKDFLVIVGKGWEEKENPAAVLEQILVKNMLI